MDQKDQLDLGVETLERFPPGHAMLTEFEQHEDELRTFIAYKLQGQSVDRTNDLMQSVALAAVTIAPDQVIDNPKAWLKSIATNKINDYWRNNDREQRLKETLYIESAATQKSTPTPSEWVIEQESHTAVAKAIELLSPDERHVLELKYFRGLKYQQIAAELSLTLKTVEYRLLRARQNLREILTKGDSPHTGDA